MNDTHMAQVRRFNRSITQTIGALEDSYLQRGRPLGEARVLFEIGAGATEARGLRARLGLDSGYFSRLLRSLERQALIEVDPDASDARRRRLTLTRKGRAEVAAYDTLSDRLAASMLAPLDADRRARLVAAMGEVERLLEAASIEVAVEPPESAAARFCLDAYFRELGERFEGGYDPASDRSAPVEDLRPPSGLLVLARLRGEPVGCGALKRIDEATSEIKRVWTAPAARGLGVARLMLRRLEAEAETMGFRVLRLDTNKALTEAHAFYLKEGYRDIARFNDNPYAHRWFEKRLGG
jgi:DNA-binding MarR family transcriptional regulator/GNAT superfamily N-acetyltransferase